MPNTNNQIIMNCSNKSTVNNHPDEPWYPTIIMVIRMGKKAIRAISDVMLASTNKPARKYATVITPEIRIALRRLFFFGVASDIL